MFEYRDDQLDLASGCPKQEHGLGFPVRAFAILP
jgi:hypothetical protein